MRSIAALAALAVTGWMALIPSARAQDVLDAWVEFLWKNYSQASCLDRAEDAVNRAVTEFGIENATTRTSEWNVLGINDDINFWVFCVADGDGLVNPDAERILVMTNVNTAMVGIGEPLRDFLSDCMDSSCPESAGGTLLGWYDNALDYRGQTGDLLDFRCPALGDNSMGTVWGTEVYTDDSPICVAAVHTGVIGTDGGAVTIEILEGRKSYRGSAQNGVTSNDWSSYDGSYRVVFP